MTDRLATRPPIRPLLAALFLAPWAIISPAPAPALDDATFTSLFNGKDLTGWEGDSVHWSVEDEAITGKTTPETLIKTNTFLVWQGGKPGDFELRLKFKLKGGNSGVQYRSKLLDPAKYVAGGYQADIDSTGKYTGINYEEKGRGILAERGQRVEIDADGKKNVVGSLGDKDELLKQINAGDWNDYVIIARGNHLVHVINGATMSEVLDNQPSKAASSGIIALQLHVGPPMTVQFKDIRLREIK